MTWCGLSTLPPTEGPEPPAVLSRRLHHALDMERAEAVQRVKYHMDTVWRIRAEHDREPTPAEIHEAYERETWWAHYILEIDAARRAMERRPREAVAR